MFNFRDKKNIIFWVAVAVGFLIIVGAAILVFFFWFQKPKPPLTPTELTQQRFKELDKINLPASSDEITKSRFEELKRIGL